VTTKVDLTFSCRTLYGTRREASPPGRCLKVQGERTGNNEQEERGIESC
jgi:hypothetical protein